MLAQYTVRSTNSKSILLFLFKSSQCFSHIMHLDSLFVCLFSSCSFKSTMTSSSATWSFMSCRPETLSSGTTMATLTHLLKCISYQGEGESRVWRLCAHLAWMFQDRNRTVSVGWMIHTVEIFWLSPFSSFRQKSVYRIRLLSYFPFVSASFGKGCLSAVPM